MAKPGEFLFQPFWSSQAVGTCMERWCPTADIPVRIRWKDLRRTTASLAAERGASELILGKFLGWAGSSEVLRKAHLHLDDSAFHEVPTCCPRSTGRGENGHPRLRANKECYSSSVTRDATKGPFQDRKRRYLEELLACRGVEEDLALRSRFGFMAFHGGSLETQTDTIAAAAAQKSQASFYAIRQPPNLRWHIPSSLFRADESPKLQAFFEVIDIVVTVHGFRRKAFPRHVMLGGRNRALAVHLAETLRPKLPGAVVVDDLSEIPESIRGVHPNNPANVPRLNGVQVELSPMVRVEPSSLIDALAEAARTFTAG